jgi:hypothetical protein
LKHVERRKNLAFEDRQTQLNQMAAELKTNVPEGMEEVCVFCAGPYGGCVDRDLG